MEALRRGPEYGTDLLRARPRFRSPVDPDALTRGKLGDMFIEKQYRVDE